MLNDHLFESMLNGPEVKINSVNIDRSGDCIIRVESQKKNTQCHCCGRMIDKSYGHGREIKLRHGSILGRKTYRVLCPKRYQCVYCKGRAIALNS